MVITDDSFSGPGYQQHAYNNVQGYVQAGTGYPYSSPMGTGYNSGAYSHNHSQQMSMGPHGHGYSHNHSHGFGQHQNQHGLTTMSAASMGFGATPCPPTSPGYGQNYGPGHGAGYGNYGHGNYGNNNHYSAFKEADD